MEKLLFTSESVTEGHPDKMCDAISDAILDALLEQDPMSRVACETAVTTGIVMVMGEITTKAYVDMQKVGRPFGRLATTGQNTDLTATPAALSLPLTSSPQTLPWAWTRLWRPKRIR